MAILGHLPDEGQKTPGEDLPPAFIQSPMELPKEAFQRRQIVVFAQDRLQFPQPLEGGFDLPDDWAQDLEGIPGLFYVDAQLVHSGYVFLGNEVRKRLQGRLEPGFEAAPGEGTDIPWRKRVWQTRHLEQVCAFRDGESGDISEHPLLSFAPRAIQLLQRVFQGRLDFQWEVFRTQPTQALQVHVLFPGGAQGAGEGPEPALVAVQLRVDGGIDKIQDTANTPGGDAHIVEANGIQPPVFEGSEFKQPADSRFQSAMQQDRKFSGMHAFILGRIQGDLRGARDEGELLA